MIWIILKVALLLAVATFMTARAIPWAFVRVGRRLGFKMQFGPTTAKRVARFKRIRRGYWAFIAMCTLLLLCAFLELLVNNKPLAIRYGDRLSFPAVKDWVGNVLFFVPISSFCKKEDFGQSGQSEVDYRAFARTCQDPEARIRDIRAAIEAEKIEYVK